MNETFQRLTNENDEQHLGLNPKDLWQLPPWSDLYCRKTPLPFDPARLRNALRDTPPRQLGEVRLLDWDRLIPYEMTRTEASFWIEACTSLRLNVHNYREMADELTRTFDPVEQSWQQLQSRFQVRSGHEAAMRAIFVVAGLDQTRALVFQPRVLRGQTRYVATFARGFRHVIPYLNEGQRQRIREELLPQLDVAGWQHYVGQLPVPFLLAAQLGMAESLRPIIEAWPDDAFCEERWAALPFQPIDLLIGLPPAEMIHHAKRLQLPILDEFHLNAWLAFSRDTELDWLCEGWSKYPEQALPLMPRLMGVSSPRLRAPMEKLTESLALTEAAQQWLDQHPTAKSEP